jgi:hypothetical protein
MAPVFRPRHLVLVAAAAATVTGCIRSPASEARMAQQFNDIGDQLNELRQDNAALRESLDSLRTVLVKHDTTLSRLANVTGVVIAK